MNRAGFFKAIGGGVAAVAGFKPVVEKPLFDFQVRIIDAPAFTPPTDMERELIAAMAKNFTYEMDHKVLKRMGITTTESEVRQREGYFRKAHNYENKI